MLSESRAILLDRVIGTPPPRHAKTRRAGDPGASGHQLRISSFEDRGKITNLPSHQLTNFSERNERLDYLSFLMLKNRPQVDQGSSFLHSRNHRWFVGAKSRGQFVRAQSFGGNS